MEYKVVITSDAEADLDGFFRYLLFEKESDQAASNVLNDFEANGSLIRCLLKCVSVVLQFASFSVIL